MAQSPVGKYTNLGVITTPYRGKTAYEPQSPGVDIANRTGTPIPFFSSGKVVGVDNGHKPGENNFGNSVVVKDNQGNRHRYSHLNRSLVNVGDNVKKGQVGMEMGATGAAYSESGKGDPSHLDYRVATRYGRYKNPMNYLRKFL